MRRKSKRINSTFLLAPKRVLLMRTALLDWFDFNGRHWIPWKRGINGGAADSVEEMNVYGIWIAEVMLQQTQLRTVLPYWEKWMQIFPNLDVLASAEEQQVLLSWQGLGYYSRARRVHKSAQILLKMIGPNRSIDSKRWPKDVQSWIILPGIGKSTAGSIISSAFDAPAAILDGNVKRVLSRLIASKVIPNENLSTLWKVSEELLDKDYPRKFNQALMDLGAMICIPNKPKCVVCPLKPNCFSYDQGLTNQIPMKGSKRKLPFETIGIGIVLNDQREVLIDQRLKDGLLGGLWEFPGGKKESDESIELTITRELKEEMDIKVVVGDHLISLDHSYSHKKLHFIVHVCHLISGVPKPISSEQVKWVFVKDLCNYPFPSANKKIIDALDEYLEKSSNQKSH